MKITKSLFAVTLCATLGWSSIAAAEPPRLTDLRESVRELAARTKTIRARAERATPQLRQESERIAQTVDVQRSAVTTRLDVLDLLGSADERSIADMEDRVRDAERLITVVESWYRPR
ncbi:MAG: hypothetical protein JWP97_5934 [Labilithrix sp.]|nr:hypothetical protein [Labilithrix sp.]